MMKFKKEGKVIRVVNAAEVSSLKKVTECHANPLRIDKLYIY